MLNPSQQLFTADQLLWQRCQEWIEQTAGSQCFETWFRTSALSMKIEGVATVEVPNTFFVSFIDGNFRDLVAQALKNCDAPPYRTLNFAAVEKDWQTFSPVVEEIARKAVPAAPLSSIPETLQRPDTDRNQSFFNHAFTFDSFVVGENNHFAHMTCMAVAEKPGATPFNPLTIFGTTGLGKTHLLQAIGNFAQHEGTADRVLYLTVPEFSAQFQQHVSEKKDYISFTRRFKDVDILLIDDIQFLTTKGGGVQRVFFEIFSALLAQKKQIVLTSDRPPKEIPQMMDTLISRFDGGLITDIKPPSFETRIAILRKKAEADGVVLPEEVEQYIAGAVTSNVRELEGKLIKLIASTSFTGRDINLATAQEIFGDHNLGGSLQRITIELIAEKTAEHFSISPAQLRVDSRKRDVTVPRNIALYLCKKHTKQALRAIGLHFGRDYSTVIHACKKVESDLSISEETQRAVSAIEAILHPYG